MQPRPAAERQKRLSLVPLVRDLNEVAAGLPAAAPSEPKSKMEWDEEETPRPKDKVSNMFRNFFSRRTIAKATPAAAMAAAVPHADPHATSARIERRQNHTIEKRKEGSIRHARKGIEARRRLELSTIRAYDELMSPLAFAQQRAHPPRRNYTKTSPQETSWPKKLREKASARSLKKKTSLASLKRLGGSSSNISQGSTSPRSSSPSQTSLVTGEIPPPVPPIPQQYLQGPYVPSTTVSPSEQYNLERSDTMASTQGESAGPRSAGSQSTRSEQNSFGSQGDQSQPGTDISPLLAYEKRKYAANSPMTPSSSRMGKMKALGSSTTVSTITTMPSLVSPHIPDDPFWDAQVAKVKKKVQQEEAEERRQQQIAAKAEKKAIREVSKEYQGRFKWAKMAVDELVGKHDEHGWQPKKDPKDFDDEDWKFVLGFLDREDTKGLRARLFKQPEWIEADKARQARYEEEMRNNPTPEFLAERKALEAKERKEYGFRKILGMLTAEEMERGRLAESPNIGLGISNTLEPVSPCTTRTTGSSEATRLSSRPSELTNPKVRSSPAQQLELESATRTSSLDDSSPGFLARSRAERMTGGFNIEGFDPRLSRLGSDEVKDYIKKKSSERPTPPTPTPKRFIDSPSLYPQQVTSVDPWMQTRAEKLAARRPQPVKKAISAADLRRDFTTYANLKSKGQPESYRSPRLPTVGVHPTLRTPETSSTSPTQAAAKSQIPVLRKAKSSIAPLNKPSTPATPDTPSSVQHQVIAAPPTPAQRNKLKLKHPPKPRKPSSAVKLPSEPNNSSASNFTSSFKAFGLGGKSPKTAPLVRKPSTSVKQPRSVSDSAAGTTPTIQPDARLTVNPKFQSHPAIPPRPGPSLSEALKVSATPAILQHPESTLAAAPTPKVTSSFSTQPTHTSSVSPPSAGDTPPSTRPEAPYTPRGTYQTAAGSPAQAQPKSSARLSRVPTFPDASDFFAVVGHSPEAQEDTGAWQSPSAAAKDRLIAKRSGIPIAHVSNVADHVTHNAGTFHIEATPPSPSFGKSKSQHVTEAYVSPRAAPAKPVLQSRDHQQDRVLEQSSRSQALTSLPPTVHAPTEVDPHHSGTENHVKLAKDKQDSQETQAANKDNRDNTEGQAFHRIEDFDAMAQVARSYAPREAPSKANVSAPDASTPTLRQMPSPAIVGEQMENYMPRERFSHASRSTTTSKHDVSPREQVQQTMPPTPSATDRGYRSFSEIPHSSRSIPATPSGRAISLGSTRFSNSPIHGHSMVFGGRRAARMPSAEGPRSAPLGQGHFDPFTTTGTRNLHSDPRGGANTPTGGRFRLRHMVGNVFNTDPVEQHEFAHNQQQSGADAEEADVSFESVISAWQQSSPPSAQQSHEPHTSFLDQEVQTLRSELGLEPIREHIPGDPKHPNHHYTWNTKKTMCRRIHNPGVVLPSLPSPVPGEPAHMADYAAEYFVGSPYTDEIPEPQRCASCHSLCCRFAHLEAESQRLRHPTDLILRNERRRTKEVIASLRVRKPNGIEEWNSFLTCSHCQRRFCPDCIALCSEKMCQDPVCAECKVGPSELCSIHNVF